MRVIKYGKTLPEKNTICKSCESELAYTDKDIHIFYAEWHHEIYVVCPVCGKRIVLQYISDGC